MRAGEAKPLSPRRRVWGEDLYWPQTPFLTFPQGGRNHRCRLALSLK